MPVSRRRRGRAATRAARSGNIPRSSRRRGTNKFYLAASVIIAVLVIASFAFASFSGGGGQVGTGSASSYVEGVGEQHSIMASTAHIIGPGASDTPARGEYSTTPPTSGEHWNDSTSPRECGFYPDGLPDESITHNLEHANIVVSYNLPNGADVAALRSAIDGIGLARAWGVTRAYPNIPEGQVAVAAWGILDTMDGVDEDRISRFFETYAGVGGISPERFPCTAAQAPHSP